MDMNKQLAEKPALLSANRALSRFPNRSISNKVGYFWVFSLQLLGSHVIPVTLRRFV